jgi:non-canonical (house-cleaning) NTP pyrophosphatase
MSAIIVAVGSTRALKLRVVADALESIDDTANFQVVGHEVPSGVRHTPVSRAELMTGANAFAPFFNPALYSR